MRYQYLKTVQSTCFFVTTKKKERKIIKMNHCNVLKKSAGFDVVNGKR